MKRARAWVTGGAGFLGSHLCDRLLAEGWEVWAVDNLSTGRRVNLSAAFQSPQFHFIEGDCTLSSLLTPLPSPDVVYHLASIASPPRYQSDPLGTMRANGIGTWTLLEMCESAKSRFVLASTSEVYGDPEVSPQPESYRGNVNCFGPRACYDESKRFAETLVWEYVRRGVDARVARIFNTFGPRMDPGDGRVVPTFVLNAISDEPLPIHGDGKQTRCLLYVDDLIEGLWRLSDAGVAAGSVVNLGGHEEVTMYDLAQVVADLAGAEPRLTWLPPTPDDPRKRWPDVRRAQELLGWTQQVPMREGLLRTMAWFRDHERAPMGGR